MGAACALACNAAFHDSLRFDPEAYRIDSITMPMGNVVKFKAYEDILDDLFRWIEKVK